MSSMFYSHLLLSKKGPLGTIWVAAHCHKRLKKDAVQQIDISSSVDKIMLDEVPLVTYRILGYLLLGVVRIYSKKVEYLFHDCRDVMNEICHFARRKKTSTHVGGMCIPESAPKKRASTFVEAIFTPYTAISLPVNFELDAFNLEVNETANRDHVKPRQEITPDDALESDRIEHHPFDKDHLGEVSAHFEDFSAAYTSLADFPSLPEMGENIVGHSSHTLSNSEVHMEKLRDNRFTLEDRLDPMTFSEGEEESDFIRPFRKEHETEMEHTKSSLDEMISGEDEEPPDQNRSFDEEHDRNAEKKMLSEMPSLETDMLQVTPDNRPVSTTIDVTPESKFPNASDAGAPTPEFMFVRTPAPRERARVSRKRKCLSDETLVLSNNVLKEWINDSSDLVCKRRKAPHTTFHAWKVHRICDLPQTFLEPIIAGIPLDLKSLICKTECETQESIKTTEAPAKNDGLGSATIHSSMEEEAIPPTIHSSMEEAAIAPSTPITQSTSLRFSEIRGITKSGGVGPASSFDSIDKEPPPSGDGEFDKILMTEELSSYEGDSQENVNAEKWTVRTRTVARYLQRNFLDRKKRREEESVNLSRVLKGKTKKESARLFYELLVLKTGGYVNVKQDKAYDDILVLDTSKLKKACGAD